MFISPSDIVTQRNYTLGDAVEQDQVQAVVQHVLDVKDDMDDGVFSVPGMTPFACAFGV